MDAPADFTDEMVKATLRRLHITIILSHSNGTIMIDVLFLKVPLASLVLSNKIFHQVPATFLTKRNNVIKEYAENR